MIRALYIVNLNLLSNELFFLLKSMTNYHMMLDRVNLAWAGFELTTLVVIGTDCIGSYKSNYHMITTTLPLYTSVFFIIHHYVLNPMKIVFWKWKELMASTS
jgi:hypothetical protein